MADKDNNCLIQLIDVSYAYPTGNKPVLSGINAAINKGELVVVIGPNGSGKSTLARLICGILPPTHGQVLVQNLDTSSGDNMDEIRRRVGLVLQNPENQLVAARVEEDVAFGPENLNLSTDEVRERVDEALDIVRLGHLKDRPPHMLSGGEKQRLALAGLLALRPACLVLDEPTSMLDPVGRRDVMEALHNLVAGGTAAVMITHHMDEAAQADRVWVLGEGCLVANGGPTGVFNNSELLSRLGLDLPSATVLAKAITSKGVHIPPGIVSMEDLVHFLCRVLSK